MAASELWAPLEGAELSQRHLEATLDITTAFMEHVSMTHADS